MFPHTFPDSAFAPRDSAEDITFAVELKFLLQQDVNGFHSKYGSVRTFVPHRPVELRESMTESETRLQRDNWEAVARAIDAIPGINATASHELQAQRRDLWKTHWTVYKANSACPPYMTYFEEDPDRPIFDTNAPDFDRFVWTPVEISSPILFWTQKAEALHTLTTVVDTINTQFNVVANASTECHVHVGRSDGKFYTLKTMKKVASLLWLSEPLLRALKDPTSPNHDHHYTWSYSWRENSRIAMALATTLPDGRTLDDLYTGKADDFDDFLAKLNNARPNIDNGSHELLQEHRLALKAVWGAVDHRELGHMLRGPEPKFRRLGFNFHALEANATGESVPRTIEFRFLEGFIDEKIVPAWVRLCGELIDLATEKAEDGDDLEFYNAVVLLLNLSQDWPMDARFSAFMQKLGRDRVPRSVYEPLQEVIRKHYPPQKLADDDEVQR